MAPHSTSPPPSSAATQAIGSPQPLVAPSLPQPNPCLSYWHRTTRAFRYLNANSDVPVPSSAKYLIIGSGLSGSLTAYSLIHNHNISGQDILILEAREAVSGASGRNAGHVRPDAFRGFQGYAAIHGAEQALKIIANEKLVFEKLDAFVKENKVPCDFHPTTTFDVCLTEEFAEYERRSFDAYVQAGGDVSHVTYFEGEEAKKRTRVKHAVAAYEWPAGSSHPAKLAQWLLTKVIESGARLFTHCPALEVVQAPTYGERAADAGRWAVKTARGTVVAEKVIHCTNAYAAALLPQLASFVTPNRAQAHSIVPSAAFSGERCMQSTMSLRYSMQHFYSLIQRQGDGTIILGVSRANPELSSATKAEIVSFDDGEFNPEIVDDALRRFKVMFPASATGKQRHGEGLDHNDAWTGIIAMTADSTPIVGSIEGLPGQYICAGHNGHGMARIWTCAPGLASLIVGGSWVETELPECFQYSHERLSRTAEKRAKPSVW